MNNIIKSEFSKSKIVLGTAQFGFRYGINNKFGILSDEQLYDLLDFAYQSGIDTLDTAFNYGNSEYRIGEYFKKGEKNFKVISKLPSINNINQVRDIFFESLSRLNQNKIYGYLIHNFENFRNENFIFYRLSELKDSGFIEKIGFSLYFTEELEELFDKEIKFDIIQIPYNILDRRFEKYFEELNKKNIEIYVRSVFLQGLFFMREHEIPKKLKLISEFLSKLNKHLDNDKNKIMSLALSFVSSNNYVHKVVIGVDSKDQLCSNINELKSNFYLEIKDYIEKLIDEQIIPEDLLIPINWQ